MLSGRDVPDAFAARLDGVHLHRREFGENLGGVLQLDPIVLNILAGSKMAIAAVICAGDMANLPHMAAAERALRNEIGRAACRHECVSTCRSRWSACT